MTTNKQKIPHCRNSSQIVSKYRRQRQNEYP